MKDTGTQRIETDRLVLRRFTLDDAEAMYRNWASDSEVTHFLSWPPHSDVEVSKRIISNWIEEYDNPFCFNWAIELKEIGEVIGSISSVSHNEKLGLVHVGYCLSRNYRRKGIMSEALRGVIDFLFSQADANKVESSHNLKNPNSGRVMASAGMSLEGESRQALIDNTGIVDIRLYSILRSEWERRRGKRVYSLGNIMIDSSDGERLADFYSKLLEWRRSSIYGLPAVVSPSGLILVFSTEADYTRPVWPEEDGKQQKQMHFDFQVGCVADAVSHALSLGAEKASEQFGGDEFTTMLDPDGHPFCLCKWGETC